MEKALLKARHSYPYRTFTLSRIAVEITFLALGSFCKFLGEINEKYELSEKYISFRDNLFK